MGDERRINQLTTKAYSDIGSSDYFAVDNASEAESKKLPVSAIKNGINDASTAASSAASTASTASTNATRALNIARSTSSFPTGDAYSSSSAYKVGDLVIYNNTLYRCKTACSAASWSTNASNFESISLASAITDLNNDLPTIETIHVGSKTVAAGDVDYWQIGSTDEEKAIYMPYFYGYSTGAQLRCQLSTFAHNNKRLVAFNNPTTASITLDIYVRIVRFK